VTALHRRLSVEGFALCDRRYGCEILIRGRVTTTGSQVSYPQTNNPQPLWGQGLTLSQ
jgi:hypothetical protein